MNFWKRWEAEDVVDNFFIFHFRLNLRQFLSSFSLLFLYVPNFKSCDKFWQSGPVHLISGLGQDRGRLPRGSAVFGFPSHCHFVTFPILSLSLSRTKSLFSKFLSLWDSLQKSAGGSRGSIQPSHDLSRVGAIVVLHAHAPPPHNPICKIYRPLLCFQMNGLRYHSGGGYSFVFYGCNGTLIFLPLTIAIKYYCSRKIVIQSF